MIFKYTSNDFWVYRLLFCHLSGDLFVHNFISFILKSSIDEARYVCLFPRETFWTFQWTTFGPKSFPFSWFVIWTIRTEDRSICSRSKLVQFGVGRKKTGSNFKRYSCFWPLATENFVLYTYFLKCALFCLVFQRGN